MCETSWLASDGRYTSYSPVSGTFSPLEHIWHRFGVGLPSVSTPKWTVCGSATSELAFHVFDQHVRSNVRQRFVRNIQKVLLLLIAWAYCWRQKCVVDSTPSTSRHPTWCFPFHKLQIRSRTISSLTMEPSGGCKPNIHLVCTMCYI